MPAPGIQVDPPGGQIILTDNSTESNSGDGVLFMARTIASMAGGDSHANGRAGAFVSPGARVRISRTSFLANQGPGIDLDPRGVTPNGVTKNGNHSLDWPVTTWDPALKRIRGVTCGGCLVEGFVREPPPRTGNPNNGEGQSFVADVGAAKTGKFVWPPVVPTCDAAQNYTFTATRPGPRAAGKRTGRSKAAPRITSEFNPPPGCPGRHTTTTNTTTTTGTNNNHTTSTTTTTNPANGGQCPSPGQTCTGQGASCDSGARCTGSGSYCGPGATCSGPDSTCSGSAATCGGTNGLCLSGASCTGSAGQCTSGSTCSGAQSACTGSATCSGSNSTCSNGSSCTGTSSVCQTGSRCSGAADTCHGSGTTCSGSGSNCDTQSGCTGPASACTGTGTLCSAGDLQSTCTQGAECTKAPPSGLFPACPGPGQWWGLILDSFTPNGVFPDQPKVTTLDGSTALPAHLCAGSGFSQTVTSSDHPEIQGIDAVDGSTIPAGRHVYRVEIDVANAPGSGTAGGAATASAGAIGRAFWHTG